MQEAFTAQLKQHEADIKQRAASEGWVNAEARYDRDVGALPKILKDHSLPDSMLLQAQLDLDSHEFQWIVRYRCANESYRDIARTPYLLPRLSSQCPNVAEKLRAAVRNAFPTSQPAVRDTIHKLTSFLHLTRRPAGKGGRPRKVS